MRTAHCRASPFHLKLSLQYYREEILQREIKRTPHNRHTETRVHEPNLG